MYFLEGRYLEKATAWAGWNNALCSTVCCVLRFTETRRDLAIKMNISVLTNHKWKNILQVLQYRGESEVRQSKLEAWDISFLSSAVDLLYTYTAEQLRFSRDVTHVRAISRIALLFYVQMRQCTYTVLRTMQRLVNAFGLACWSFKPRPSRGCVASAKVVKAVSNIVPSKIFHNSSSSKIQGHRPTQRGMQVSVTRSVDAFKCSVQCIHTFQLLQQDEDGSKGGGQLRLTE